MHRLSRIGAYGLVAVANQILLVRKGRGPFIGAWDLPGSGVEFGDDPLEALAQGMRRETGMPLLMSRLLVAQPHTMTWRIPSGDMVELFQLGLIYRVRVDTDQPLKAGGNGEEVLEARWQDLPLQTSLEVSPFVDQALLEFAASTPAASVTKPPATA